MHDTELKSNPIDFKTLLELSFVWQISTLRISTGKNVYIVTAEWDMQINYVPWFIILCISFRLFQIVFLFALFVERGD